MPHHTFAWEGIDGTRIFTHFPPVDTYAAELSGAELARAERRFAEKGRANTSLVPFGWGDGGGGPTREMLAAAARTRSLEGSPTVRIASPGRVLHRPPRRSTRTRRCGRGELYLEFHRGTYTSQARTKRGNRRSEHLLREAELWATTAAVRAGAAYPYDALEACWRTVLLQQFHDILPGTSIAWVHRQAEREYARVAAELDESSTPRCDALAGDGSRDAARQRRPVRGRRGARAGRRGRRAGRSRRRPSSETGEGVVLDNGALRVVVDGRGLLASVRDLAADRELLRRAPRQPAAAAPGHADPWDAWDVDLRDRRVGRDLVEADSVTVEGPVACGSSARPGRRRSRRWSRCAPARRSSRS